MYRSSRGLSGSMLNPPPPKATMQDSIITVDAITSPRGKSRGARRCPEFRSSSESAMKRMEYGWIIVATLCVTETVSWGIVYYGFPVFLQAMEKDLAVSRVAVTGALS